jgi:hypothetical protein
MRELLLMSSVGEVVPASFDEGRRTGPIRRTARASESDPRFAAGRGVT